MSDAATIIAGAAVLVVLIISSYFMIKAMRNGGCNNCEGCKKRDSECARCNKNEEARK